MNRPRQQAPEDEIRDRTKRIETRLTQLMIALGVDTRSEKPRFDQFAHGLATVKVPSVHCSVKEILDSVPTGWHGDVQIYLGSEQLARLSV